MVGDTRPRNAGTRSKGKAMKRLALVLPILLLTACDREPQVDMKDASVAEVARKVDAQRGSEILVRPGKWAQTVTMETFDIPGMPESAQASVRETMKTHASGHEICLTQADTRRPSEDFFAGKDSNCRYERFAMKGGKIDGVMRCSHDGMTQVMELSGDYAPDHYAMRMDMRTQSERTNMGNMHMVMRVDAKRVGDCDAAATEKKS
jgi:hypothetical protein